ncbi:type IV secretion system protein VirB1 [Ochrobactrum anthropi]|uniref:transglycosylase SLT domain-containing protein n=1 Tax=Brucella anthropi TaxID=529 RepID=UPI0015F80CF5|nr:transglycosylase SLT domain-containing protein [Brucella anthropi]MBA8862735.1 type IV secretion system protein VirB1 [Brucella anthropi]
MTIGFVDLAQQCAPMMDSVELAAIVSVESGFNPLNIRISNDKALREQPKSKEEAIAIATSLQVEGELVDLGLGGIGLQSLGQLGLTVADAFDPCKNIAATAHLIGTYYAAARVGGSTDPKRDALWAYSGRGDPEPGRITGYDKLIDSKQAQLKPKLASIKLQTGAAPHALARNGNDQGVARVGGASALPPETEAQEPPQRSSPASAAMIAPEKSTTSQWDIFSSTRNSQVFIFKK